jgi:hypothetical protein
MQDGGNGVSSKVYGLMLGDDCDHRIGLALVMKERQEPSCHRYMT